MRLKLFCIFLFSFLFGFTQDNNTSISDELKSIWGNETPIYSTPSSSDLFSNEEPALPGGNVQTDAPIDGGLGFLLAAGAGYVAHGLNRKRKRRKTDEDEETDSASK